MKKFKSVTIQIKATEQYFAVVLFAMLYEVVLTFKSVDEILKCADHSNESYRAVLSCGTDYDAACTILILAFESVNEILKCDHSNESYRAALFYGVVRFSIMCKIEINLKFFQYTCM